MRDLQPVSTDDYIAIQRLMGRAADAVTRGDLDQFIGCWTEDAVWTIGLTRGSLAGRSTILKNFQHIRDDLDAIVQTVDNGDAWYDGKGAEVAHARFYVTELIRRRTGENLLLRFFYTDRLVRADGGWLFAERVLNPLYVGPYDLSGPFHSSSSP
ncbi:YybH family protein [Nocardia neocaledoniensis]|uniref:YybH family protein n=1 Tax=Nocardia neocaledoniensis TaxID=236511 RepID=UPI0024573E5D|nr:nuclear transport factor 2 family protein [Nocardia neocaledoniensis]